MEKLIKNNQVINIYNYGSIVYETNHAKSDRDYIVVVEDTNLLPDNGQIIRGEITYNVYDEDQWKHMLETNHIEALECSFIPDCFIVKEQKKFNLRIDIVELRKSISSVSSNSYVKCKKKLIEGEHYTAKKSLWHSIRILMYGIQCAKYGRITDYTEANKYYNEIVNNGTNDWEHFSTTYRPLYNQLKSEFKKLTEDEWKTYKGGN